MHLGVTLFGRVVPGQHGCFVNATRPRTGVADEEADDEDEHHLACTREHQEHHDEDEPSSTFHWDSFPGDAGLMGRPGIVRHPGRKLGESSVTSGPN